MKIGQRVNSPLGKGTVIAIEVHDAPVAWVTPRWEVKLDDPAKWVPSILGFNPFLPARDLCDENHDLSVPVAPEAHDTGKFSSAASWYVFHCPNCQRQVSQPITQCACGQAIDFTLLDKESDK